MKTLDQILTTGTDAEKQLAKLAQDMPTEPQKVLRKELVSATGMFLLYGVTFSSCSVACYENENTFDKVIFGLGALAMGIGTLIGSSYIKDNLSLLGQQIQQKRGKSPASSEIEFYCLNDKFTYAPTPIDKKYGKRVYPLEKFSAIPQKTDKSYFAFFTNVHTREISSESYTHLEPVSGAGGFADIEILKIKKEIELSCSNEVSTIIIDRTLDNKFLSFYNKLIPQDNLPLSLLLLINEMGTENGKKIYLSDIQEVYACK